MRVSDETTRGFQFLKDIIERGEILKLDDPQPTNGGRSYLLTVRASEKEWYFSLGRSQLDDLPGTKSYHEPAIALARGLERRFLNVNPNFFTTLSGRLLKIVIEWPPMQWMSQTGGIVSATGLWVRVTDLVTNEVARCPVLTTHQQEMYNPGTIHFSRPAWVTNTIRTLVDSGFIKFYSNSDLPRAFPDAKMQSGEFSVFDPKSIQSFVASKVWLLGFKAGGGRTETKVWVADPWDAEYLGCTEADLREAAAILDAQGKIVIGQNDDFAYAAKPLIASGGQIESPPIPKTKETFKTVFDVYTPNGLIGEGGSGRVIRVLDRAGKQHALKYLKPDRISSEKERRFKNELAFCFKNAHRNIITVEDWGLAEIDESEVPFYVMPIFPKTLRSVMQQENSPEKMLRLFMQILDGVEAAHNRGIWHRDLKPENILFDETDDQIVVSDFGIAHFSDDAMQTSVETRAQERLANFRYAAPEQRSNGIVDHRTDIYSLGLILYEMLTSQLLQGTSHTRVASIHPKLASLDSIIEKMSCQSPSDRPFSIAEIRVELASALDKSR
jgi:tRNA A-37 threonylcarbamoyl transferase component Bud32